ncbi:MAG TPA: hypothetical protein VFF49_12185 [Thermodesulfobacteriota bacterium]|nr:hypothetical protein [Thermodesulfobacteriota bacterium]
MNQEKSPVIAKSKATMQSGTDCHSEPCPESKRRNGEESQTDRFGGIWGIPDRVGDQEGG